MQQLEADNAELQAELQHLAATLRAALTTAPDGVHVLASVDLPPGGLGQLNGGGGMLDWSPPDGASASMLSSFDTSPAASEANGSRGADPGAGGGGSAAPVYHQPTSVSRATLSCSMQHPGSICCSKLSSTVDPSGSACTISLHTTAR